VKKERFQECDVLVWPRGLERNLHVDVNTVVVVGEPASSKRKYLYILLSNGQVVESTLSPCRVKV
jgi:hypothetical protein